ncbi:MAG: isopeptide-forming domain-containing fimbrial protein, partial [Clostridia bacterium]|nr:isopeptide-forming domain-containing fimbrial protein [Clostridia bacterium]
MALIAASAGAAFAATGTGSVSVTGAKEGETYSFYRVLDLDYLANGGQEAFAYTVNPDFQDFFDAVLEKTGGESARAHEVYEYINAQNTADELEALCVALGSYALDRSIAPAMALETDASGSASKYDAGFGYYLMVPEVESGSAIFALDTVKPDAEIANKSVYPTVTKTVSDADETDAETNVAGVGDVLTFKLSSAVPVMTGYTSYTFRFVDTMTN